MLPQVPQYATLYSSTSTLPITDTPFSMLISPVYRHGRLPPLLMSPKLCVSSLQPSPAHRTKRHCHLSCIHGTFWRGPKKIPDRIYLFTSSNGEWEYLESWNASSCGMTIRVPDMVWNVYPSVYRLCRNIEFSAITQHLDFVDFVLLIYPLNSLRK
jgi:hypothetical protein